MSSGRAQEATKKRWPGGWALDLILALECAVMIHQSGLSPHSMGHGLAQSARASHAGRQPGEIKPLQSIDCLLECKYAHTFRLVEYVSCFEPIRQTLGRG